MRFFTASLLLAAAAVAAPVAQPGSASTAAGTGGSTEPPPLWDPPALPAPPLFEAPKEDLPLVPSWLVSVHEAPVQAVRVEKLAPFTGAKVQPLDNIYAPSSSDEEAGFTGQGSLRPGHKSLAQCVSGFVRSWIWWIGIVVIAAVLVYLAEKMLIGSVKAARKARSASRVARSRAASLMQGTRSRAASLLGDGGRSRSNTLLKEKSGIRVERSPSPPARSKSWDENMP